MLSSSVRQTEGVMAESVNILDVIFALRETDRSEGLFRPIVETENLVWRFEITEFDVGL